jgi:hypothetical protein
VCSRVRVWTTWHSKGLPEAKSAPAMKTSSWCGLARPEYCDRSRQSCRRKGTRALLKPWQAGSGCNISGFQLQRHPVRGSLFSPFCPLLHEHLCDGHCSAPFMWTWTKLERRRKRRRMQVKVPAGEA